jgi:hypothetical protein
MSNPKPGASLGTSQPSFGTGMLGKGLASSNGTPGAEPMKNSHQGAMGVAKVKCCPKGVLPPA